MLQRLKQNWMGLVCLGLSGALTAASAAPPASLADPQFKLKIDFNRWHSTAELKVDMERLAKTWPKFLKLQSIGKSYQGRDLMLMTINNPDTGPEMSKAAMYIDANIHGNEIQGAEVCLYTIWYLMENYGRLEKITRLVNERVFYIVPTVNPDGRECFFGDCGNSRSGQVPQDDDNDGVADEDRPNDLNGNGVIEQIRKYVPGKGTHRLRADDPRFMEAVPKGQMGDYILLGDEGLDDDGDGAVDEDDGGSYDGNRNWPVNWHPRYIQNGAMDYPFQLPETRAVGEFIAAHPNIAGAQSYHNSGGMILRGPKAKWMGEMPPGDVRAYDELGRNGERMLPFYKYMITWRDLYTVHGGMLDWTAFSLGIISFTNELWADPQYFGSPELQKQLQESGNPISRGGGSQQFFGDYLEFGSTYLPWKPYKHPQYGDVEIGGSWTQLSYRVPPRFMNEELSHRNMAFTLYQADEMPLIRINDTDVQKISNDTYRVYIDLENPKVAPTITEQAAGNGVVRPDLLTLEGKAEVVAAGWGNEDAKFRRLHHDGETKAWHMHRLPKLIDQKELKRIMVREGTGGKTTRTLEYIVRGSGTVTFTYDSVKGGKVSKQIVLKD